MNFAAADALYPHWLALVVDYNKLYLAPWIQRKRSRDFIRVHSEEFHFRATRSRVPRYVQAAHDALVAFETRHDDVVPPLIFLYEKRHRAFTDEEFYAIWELLRWNTVHADYPSYREERGLIPLEEEILLEQTKTRATLDEAVNTGKISLGMHTELYYQYNKNHRREHELRTEIRQSAALRLFEELFLGRVIRVWDNVYGEDRLRLHSVDGYRQYNVQCEKCKRE